MLKTVLHPDFANCMDDGRSRSGPARIQRDTRRPNPSTPASQAVCTEVSDPNVVTRKGLAPSDQKASLCEVTKVSLGAGL